MTQLQNYHIRLQFVENVVVEYRGDFCVGKLDKDGFLQRRSGDLILKTKDISYFFKGAKTCKTLKTAKSWIKKIYENDDEASEALKNSGF